MASIKCTACGLVNFADATVCRRCKAWLQRAAAPEPAGHAVGAVFEDAFSLTDPAEDPRSVIETLQLPNARARRAGVYGNGLLTLLSASFDAGCFSAWPPMASGRFVPIAYDAMGDFYLWDHEKQRVSRMALQSGALQKAADTIDEFLDVLCLRPEARIDLLSGDLIDQLVKRWGPLRYGIVFILVPWLMLGGEPRPENFETGEVAVYVDLVGQTHFG